MNIKSGIVTPDGTKNSGTGGWHSRKTGTAGVYSIQFEPNFKSTPTVVATQIFPHDMSSSGGDCRDNAVIVGVNANEVKIKVGDANGTGAPRWFSFMAVADT